MRFGDNLRGSYEGRYMNVQTFTDKENALLNRIGEVVRQMEPSAQIVLYGSRARGDAARDSDWDLLVLLDGPVDHRRKDALNSRILDLELATGAVIGVIAYGKEEWASARLRAMPFHENVTREGIALLAGDGIQPSIWQLPPEPEEQAMNEAREDLVQYRLGRAHETLSAAVTMAQAGYWNCCVNRLYYACFYAVTALLLRHRMSSHRHSGVQALFNQHFGGAGLIAPELMTLYNDLFKARLDADYADMVDYHESQVRPLIAEAERFVRRIEELLATPPGEAQAGGG